MSKKRKLKIGDVVQLKSGGPRMTVMEVRETYFDIKCQ